jgi:hypothetical protein
MEVSVALRLGRFTFWVGLRSTHWIEACVGARACVDDMADMKFLDPVGNQTMLTPSKYLNVHSKTANRLINNYTFLSSRCTF